MPPIAAPYGAYRAVAEAAEGANLAVYAFTKYYGAARKGDPKPVEVNSLTFFGDAENGEEGVGRGLNVASAVSLARDLSNEPASVLNPATLVEEARRVAAEQNLEIKVLGPDEMAELGMGAFLAVGKGSATPPQLIHLIYRPDDAPRSTRSIGLVGKCITFDTGGYLDQTLRRHAGNEGRHGRRRGRARRDVRPARAGLSSTSSTASSARRRT